jgi:hypothetical protein
MIPFEADLDYNSRVLLNILSTLQFCQSLRIYPAANFTTHLVGILQDLQISLASIFE